MMQAPLLVQNKQNKVLAGQADNQWIGKTAKQSQSQ